MKAPCLPCAFWKLSGYPPVTQCHVAPLTSKSHGMFQEMRGTGITIGSALVLGAVSASCWNTVVVRYASRRQIR